MTNAAKKRPFANLVDTIQEVASKESPEEEALIPDTVDAGAGEGVQLGQIENRESSPQQKKSRRHKNIGIQVPREWAIHWSIEAKRRDMTLTQCIVEALTDKYGLPS